MWSLHHCTSRQKLADSCTVADLTPSMVTIPLFQSTSASSATTTHRPSHTLTIPHEIVKTEAAPKAIVKGAAASTTSCPRQAPLVAPRPPPPPTAPPRRRRPAPYLHAPHMRHQCP
eukprot:3032629-Prymnesium_polylepis.1